MATFEPVYTLFNSIEEMLARETLSDLMKLNVSQVTCRPFDSSNGFSRNELFHVEADDQKLVMKRLRPAVDWLAIVSNDHRCRSIRVWQYGLLDRLLPHLQHGILAACRAGDDYSLLMRDVSPGLLNGQEISLQSVYRLLDALARMHAMFWEQENLKTTELGLGNTETILSFIGPAVREHYLHAPHILDMINQGRSALFDLVEPDVSDALQSLMETPLPLMNFLAQSPKTFVHSDFRQDNLALLPNTQELFAFDWQMASYEPATLDLCWFVGSLAEQLDQHELFYQYYQQQLSIYLGDRFDPDLWQPMLAVGCLVEVLRKGSWFAYFATTTGDESFRDVMRQVINSYNNHVRKGLGWL
jgi:hypothetical protein